MKKLFKQSINALLATSLCAALVLPAAQAKEVINLTAGSSHPTTIPWVGMIQNVFIPEVNRILAEDGRYEINWTEAYAGQLYKANATLTSIADGIADVGWVFSYLEGSRMPLSQISAYTPFTTSDPELMLDVMNDLVRSVPELNAEWEDNNVVFLGATASDTYDMYTNFPVKKLSDFNGHRISAPGVLGVWLSPIEITPVAGTLASYYTDIQTGVSEGVVSLATGMLPTRVYEVAPYITKVNMGVVFSGGLGFNMDRYEDLPKVVQDALMAAGAKYSLEHGKDLTARHQSSIEKMVELGASQSTPVQVYNLTDAQRKQWIDSMPNLAQEWVKNNEDRGLPARRILNTYMDAMRERGFEPERPWDKL